MKLHEIIPGQLYQRGKALDFDGKYKGATLREKGVAIVVNLWHVEDPELAGEFLYVHHPLPDGRIDEGTRHRLLLMARGVAALSRERGGVLTQCLGGRNRSGLISALLARELLGISGREARQLVQSKRTNSLTNEHFCDWLDTLPAGRAPATGHLLYVFGEPGVGKSTLMEHLANGHLTVNEVPQPFAHRVYGSFPAVVELGRRREEFSGTDALSMSVQPKVIEWLDDTPYKWVVGEGDRLATPSFLRAVTEAGWSKLLVRLALPPERAAERRLGRARELGRKVQDEPWVQGRRTKVENVMKAFPRDTVTLNAERPPSVLVQQLKALGDPIAHVLTREEN